MVKFVHFDFICLVKLYSLFRPAKVLFSLYPMKIPDIFTTKNCDQEDMFHLKHIFCSLRFSPCSHSKHNRNKQTKKQEAGKKNRTEEKLQHCMQ